MGGLQSKELEKLFTRVTNVHQRSPGIPCHTRYSLSWYSFINQPGVEVTAIFVESKTLYVPSPY